MNLFLKEHSNLPNGLFGKLFWNIFSTYLVIFLILGILSLLEIRPIDFNGEPTYGIMGLVSALLMAPLIALSTAFAIWLMVIFGNLVMKLFVK